MFEVELPPRKAQGGGHVFIFLSLFFLLLAFFVALNSIATFEINRTRAVLFSVTTTFSNEGADSLKPDWAVPLESPILMPEEFHRTLADLVATVFPLATVEPIRPDRMMEITVPAETVFVAGQADLRPEVGVLLDGIADGLVRHPPGLRYMAEITVDGAPVTPQGLAQGETLAISRAAALAKEIIRRGAPRTVLAAGVARGEGGNVRLTFRGRSDEAPTVDLHQLVR